MDKHTEAQSIARQSRSTADADLPRYTSSRASIVSQGAELTDHSYTLDDSRGRPWIWLYIKSRAKDKKVWPVYYEKDTITGTVEVDFSKTDGARAVLITLTGGVTMVGQEEHNFMNVGQILWDAKSAGKAPNGKLSWPFALTIPHEALIMERPKARPEDFRMPPTFSERASPAYIDYKIVVTVRRGTFKVNQILQTSFFYTPLSRAEVPSAIRQASYVNGTPLVGPEGDPEGWKILPDVQVTGTLFETRPVTMVCTVALATPLSYATGSPIPLFVTFRSSDEQALDLLCSPTAVKICIVRERLVGSHATKSEGAGPSGRSNNTFREVMTGAAFWPSLEGAQEPGKRVLQGELELKKALRPSFTFPGFALRYDVCMYPPQAPGFVAADPHSSLFSERVTINVLNAVGVVPRSYAPPGYSHSTEGNYNNVAGYLENGNQRFYHHGGFM